MIREGYIRIHRSLLEWEWYGDEAVKVLFLHLLLRVNWKAGRFRGQDVPPGCVVCSLQLLAESLGWSRSKLRHTLDKLKSTGEVASTTTNHWTTLTLVNWAKYQAEGIANDQPSDQPTANQRPTNSQPMATIEEGKKERREKGNGEERDKRATPPPPSVPMEWPSWAGPKVKAAWEEFKDYKRTTHRFRYKTPATEQHAINLLAHYFTKGEDCFNALNEAMAKGWKFPVDPAEMKRPDPKHEPGAVKVTKPWMM